MASTHQHSLPFCTPLRGRHGLIICGIALAAFLYPAARATDDPGEALRRQFDAAKSSLATGDLPKAEGSYRQTIALGLRQLANLSISEERFEEATRLFGEALKLTPSDADLQVDASVAWFRRGDPAKAAELVQAVLALHPENARAHNVLGRIALFRGDAEESISELKKAVDLQHDFETSYFLGVAYLKAKRVPEASALFKELESSMGDSAALHVLFGRAYLLTHFPPSAVEEFRKAIQLDPRYPRAHSFLGYASLESYGESFYPQARKLFEQELLIQPDDYLTLLLLGITTTSLRDYPAAETALLHSTRLRPDGASPYLYLGETYTATKRLKQAVEALEKYISLMRDPGETTRDLSRAYYLLGQDLLRLGRMDEAKLALANSQRHREAKFRYDVQHIFDEKPSTDGTDSRPTERIAGLLESGAPDENKSTETMLQGGLPENTTSTAQPPVRSPASEPKAAKQYRAFVSEILASSYNDLGVMRAKNSEFAAAAEFFKQAAAWNPSLPGLDRNWGLASYRADLYPDAIPPLERQLAAHPDDNFVRQLLGMSYYLAENFSKTAEVFHPFLKAPPDDPALLFAWGTALVRIHQSDAAMQIFRRLLEQNANNPDVHLLLGQAHAQQEDYPSALAELRTAMQLDPRLPDAHYYTGLVHLHQSEFELAAQEFRAELQLRPSDPITTYHLGYTLLAQGHPADAVPLFRDVIKALPRYEFAHFELGRALLQQGDTAGAIESLETARKLSPDRDATYFQLSQAYRRAGRTQDAAQALATFQKRIETNRLKKRESLEMEKP
jgi:tetratricopeptide (TPR) repeat protein